jgi:hypothetical protein
MSLFLSIPLSLIKQWLLLAWHFSSPRRFVGSLFKVFKEPPVLAFRKPKSLKNMLVRDHITSRSAYNGQCQTCDSKRCMTCNAHINPYIHIQGNNSPYTAMPTARQKILATSWKVQFVAFNLSEKLNNNLVNAWIATEALGCPNSFNIRPTRVWNIYFGPIEVTVWPNTTGGDQEKEGVKRGYYFLTCKVAILTWHKKLKKYLSETKIVSFNKVFNSLSLCFVYLVLLYQRLFFLDVYIYILGSGCGRVV